MPIKVEKRDGTQEDFDRNKVSGGLVGAGVNSEDAERIADDVESWTQEVAVNGVVKASDIKFKVLELLRPINPEIASRFETYHK
jgi:transcriptional regulator NrdR family protein